MFWKTTGEISDQSYRIYKPIIIFFRILGLFPVTVRRNKSKLHLRLSPCILICGFIFGAFAIFMAYWGIFIEISVNKEDSIRITSDTDKLMMFIDVTAYSSVFFCGYLLSPTKFKSLFNYLRFLHEADIIIKTSYKKIEKYIFLIVILVVLIINLVLGWVDLSDSYSISGDKIGLLGVLHRYMGMDFLALMVNIIECINQILLNAMRKRIQKLNVLLKIQYERVNKMAVEKKRILIFNEPVYSEEGINKNYVVLDEYWVNYNQITVDDVIQLNNAYQIILDAADVLNEFLGVSIVVMVVATLWGLIESSYFFLLAFSGNRGDLRDAIEIPGALVVIFFHIFRMMLITEPPHACLAQVESTKCLVCKLLSCNVDQNYKKELLRFAMVLELRKLQFSASGLFLVDRALFTSLLDTIVTLLVILLQYRNKLSI